MFINSLTRKPFLYFLLSALVCAYWVASQTIDMNALPDRGALFEQLWLPMLALVFLLPLWLIYMWYKMHWKPAWFIVLPLLMHIATFIFLFIFSKP